jgi:FMN phosphatase YigB (HAD superfamily)
LDLGDVLVRTRPRLPYEQFERLSGIAAAEIERRLTNSGVVQAYETGILFTSEFIRRACEATGMLGLSQDEFAAVFTSIIADLDDVLVPSVVALADAGRIMFLSNTNELHWMAVRDRLAVAGIGAPAVLSFQIGLAKPDHRFFMAIPEEWRSSSLYVDDRHAYVDAAAAVGIRGHVHEDASHTAELLDDLLYRDSFRLM